MRKILYTFTLLLLAHGLFSQNNPHTVLWEVRKAGVPYKSYLFGTFHEVNATFFSSLTTAVQQLEHSSLLYVEATIAEQSKVTGNVRLLTWNVQKWDSLLTTKQKATFEAFVKKAENDGYYKLAPLTLTLELFRLYAQNFCDTLDRQSAELMDNYIQKLALAKKIPTASLDDNQEDVIGKSANYNSVSKDAGYAAGCINLMEKMLQNDASECTVINKYKQFNIDYEFDSTAMRFGNPLLIIDRNNRWMTMLDKAFKERNCFVAAGYRHLMYKEGLIQQLRKRGYIVTPVAPK